MVSYCGQGSGQIDTTQFSTLGTLRSDDNYEYEFSVLRMSVLADIIHWETFSCHTHPLCCLIIQTRDKRLKNVNNYSMSARWIRDDRCDIIILYLTSESGIIVLLKTPTNYGQIFPTLFCENKLMRTVTDICRPWYNRSYTMMAKPMKTLWMHYAMIEFVMKGNTPYQGQNTSLTLCNVKRFANLVRTYGERRRKKTPAILHIIKKSEFPFSYSTFLGFHMTSQRLILLELRDASTKFSYISNGNSFNFQTRAFARLTSYSV